MLQFGFACILFGLLCWSDKITPHPWSTDAIGGSHCFLPTVAPQERMVALLLLPPFLNHLETAFVLGTGWLLAETAGIISVPTAFEVWPSWTTSTSHASPLLPEFLFVSHPRPIMLLLIVTWIYAHWLGVVGTSGCWVVEGFQGGDILTISQWYKGRSKKGQVCRKNPGEGSAQWIVKDIPQKEII